MFRYLSYGHFQTLLKNFENQKNILTLLYLSYINASCRYVNSFWRSDFIEIFCDWNFLNWFFALGFVSLLSPFDIVAHPSRSVNVTMSTKEFFKDILGLKKVFEWKSVQMKIFCLEIICKCSILSDLEI